MPAAPARPARKGTRSVRFAPGQPERTPRMGEATVKPHTPEEKRREMSNPDRPDDALLAKLRSLPAEDLVEVESFVETLCRRRNSGSRVRAFTALSEGAFGEVWDNPDDAEYDRL